MLVLFHQARVQTLEQSHLSVVEHQQRLEKSATDVFTWRSLKSARQLLLHPKIHPTAVAQELDDGSSLAYEMSDLHMAVCLQTVVLRPKRKIYTATSWVPSCRECSNIPAHPKLDVQEALWHVHVSYLG